MNAFLNKIYTLDLVSIHLSYTLKKGLTVPLNKDEEPRFSEHFDLVNVLSIPQ